MHRQRPCADMDDARKPFAGKFIKIRKKIHQFLSAAEGTCQRSGIQRAVQAPGCSAAGLQHRFLRHRAQDIPSARCLPVFQSLPHRRGGRSRMQAEDFRIGAGDLRSGLRSGLNSSFALHAFSPHIRKAGFGPALLSESIVASHREARKAPRRAGSPSALDFSAFRVLSPFGGLVLLFLPYYNICDLPEAAPFGSPRISRGRTVRKLKGVPRE